MNTILVVVCCLTKMALFIPPFGNDSEDWLVSSCHRSLHNMGPRLKLFPIGQTLHLAILVVAMSTVRHQANLSTTYHPANGWPDQRVNPDLGTVLWVYINYNRRWGHLLPLAEFAYNNTSLSATMVTPFFATRGFIQNLKCLSNLCVGYLLTRLLQISRSSIGTFTTKYLVPSDNYEVHSASQHLPIPPFKVGGTLSG